MISSLLLTILFSFFIIHILKNQKSIQRLEKRSHKYLCFKNIHKTTLSYIQSMGTLNSLIATSYLGLPKTKIIHEGLMKTQSFLHIKYLTYNFKKLPFCNISTKTQILSRPIYQTQNTYLLQRLPNGVVPLRSKTWSITLLPEKNANFILKGNFRIENLFSKTFSFSSKEYALDLNF